jgi:hypothetical protein
MKMKKMRRIWKELVQNVAKRGAVDIVIFRVPFQKA